MTSYLLELFPGAPTEAILVIGGFDGNRLSDVEIVSLDENEECRKPRAMTKGIYGMVGYFDEDGNKAIVCGGRDGRDYLDTCFEYSLETDEWNEARFRMKEKRLYAASVLLNNGSFFVLGGHSSYECSEFPIEGRESMRLAYRASQHCLCQINQTHLFMAGGDQSGTKKLTYTLNLDSGRFDRLPDMTEDREDHLCHPIKGGREVLAIGGYFKSSVESFSFDLMSWRSVNPMPRRIEHARYVVEYKETFLIVGGLDRDSWRRDLDTLYEFVPSNYGWLERSEKLKKGRSHHLSLPLKSGWKERAKVCN